MVKIDFVLKELIQQVFIDYLLGCDGEQDMSLLHGDGYIHISFQLPQEVCDRHRVWARQNISIPCPTPKVFCSLKQRAALERIVWSLLPT